MRPEPTGSRQRLGDRKQVSASPLMQFAVKARQLRFRRRAGPHHRHQRCDARQHIGNVAGKMTKQPCRVRFGQHRQGSRLTGHRHFRRIAPDRGDDQRAQDCALVAEA